MELNHFAMRLTRSCVDRLYLDTFFTATEQSCICQFQSLLGLCTLLTIIFQSPEFSFINGKSLKSLLWTQVALKFGREILTQKVQSQVEANLKARTEYKILVCLFLFVCLFFLHFQYTDRKAKYKSRKSLIPLLNVMFCFTDITLGEGEKKQLFRIFLHTHPLTDHLSRSKFC